MWKLVWIWRCWVVFCCACLSYRKKSVVWVCFRWVIFLFFRVICGIVCRLILVLCIFVWEWCMKKINLFWICFVIFNFGRLNLMIFNACGLSTRWSVKKRRRRIVVLYWRIWKICGIVVFCVLIFCFKRIDICLCMIRVGVCDWFLKSIILLDKIRFGGRISDTTVNFGIWIIIVLMLFRCLVVLRVFLSICFLRECIFLFGKVCFGRK